MSRIGRAARRIPTPIGRRLHAAAVATELAIIRMRDWRSSASASNEVGDLTATVKTFERPKVLGRLLQSVARHYPDLSVIVADDSRDPQLQPGVETLVLPFNSGVSAGRNAALERVSTEFVLLLDDDFILTARSGVVEALRAMRAYPDIDIMGGRVVNLPLFNTTDYSRPSLHGKVPRPEGSVGGFPIYNIVPNFFIARTERLRSVGWTPEIRVLDHTDFFTRAYGVLTTVYNPELRCFHANTPFDVNYMRFRQDLAHDHAVLRKRWK